MPKSIPSPCRGAIVAMLLLAATAEAPHAKTRDPAVIMTENGAVRGVIHDGVREFKGIPYAAPPVDRLRWAMPRPPRPWTRTLDASRYRSACPQVERYGLTEASETEDCLYLNVTAPFAASRAKFARKRPVIVWIHGGAFVGGSSSLYRLDAMARSGDVVVVSMNYRLGVFEFVAHPSFEKSHNGGYGLEDQRAALRWVKHNIAAFGGDPDNVTLAGKSAGAAGVCMHILAPRETKGLFNKAIVQSAGCVTPLPTVDDGNKIGQKIAAMVGCSDDRSALTCLRMKTVKVLLAAAATVAGSSIVTYMPVTGTRTVPLPGAKAIPAEQFVRVPMINGGTSDELRLYVAYAVQAGQSVRKDNYLDLLRETYGKNAEAVAATYPAANYSSAAAALGTVWSDFRPDVGINNCIYLETAKLIRQRVPVYEFVFADRNAPAVTADPGFAMGAVHSSELPYQFPGFDNTTEPAGGHLAPASQKLADQMLAYWTSFARTGKPHAAGAPDWASMTSDDRVLKLDPGRLGNFNANAAHKCDFWKRLYPGILTRNSGSARVRRVRPCRFGLVSPEDRRTGSAQAGGSSLPPAAPRTGARLAEPLAPGDHGFDQVFSMRQAGRYDPQKMQRDEDDHRVCDPLVHLFDPPCAPERIGGHQVARRRQPRQAAQQRDDHEPAERVVPGVSPRPHPGDVTQIGERRARRANEIDKPRMPWSDEAPDDPKHDQAGDHVSRADVQPLDLVSAEEGDPEQYDQRPVERADERVPHPDRGRRRRAGGIDPCRQNAHGAAHIRPTMLPLVGSTNGSTRVPLPSIA